MSKKTKEQYSESYLTSNSTDLPDNTAGHITPARVRAALQDLIDSIAVWAGENTVIEVDTALEAKSAQFTIKISDGVGGPNICMGHKDNSIAPGTNVRSNTISGGGYPLAVNKIDGDETRYATIGGGYNNHIDGANSECALDGAASTIAGGAHHVIQSTHSSIVGGSYGKTGPLADYATILGGTRNTVNGPQSAAWGTDVTVNGTRSLGLAKSELVVNENDTMSTLFNLYRFLGGNIEMSNGKGLVLKNAAGTVTKVVRLNDAGDGLVFENV